jgi:hypothetical protein
MGSYMFYRRLDDQAKTEVYRFYLKNPHPQRVRDKILEVMKN